MVLDSNRLQEEYNRLIREAQMEYEQDVGSAIDHLDDRQMMRWATIRNRIRQQVYANSRHRPDLNTI
jgi:hypothetical protein